MITAHSITQPISCWQRKQLSVYKPISKQEAARRGSWAESDRSGSSGLCVLKTGKVSSTDAKHHGSAEPDAQKLCSFPSSQLASTNSSFSYGAVTALDVHNNQSPRNWGGEREENYELRKAPRCSISNLAKPQHLGNTDVCCTRQRPLR